MARRFCASLVRAAGHLIKNCCPRREPLDVELLKRQLNLFSPLIAQTESSRSAAACSPTERTKVELRHVYTRSRIGLTYHRATEFSPKKREQRSSIGGGAGGGRSARRRQPVTKLARPQESNGRFAPKNSTSSFTTSIPPRNLWQLIGAVVQALII